MADAGPTRLTARAGRSFGLTLGGALILLGAVLWWRGRGLPAAVLLGLGLALVCAGVLVPARLGPVFAVWMGFGKAVSKVTTPVVLGAVYFVVVTPLSVMMRLFGRNPLRRPLREGSYWASVPSGGRSDLDNQF